jgi:hypothetical protein
MSECFINIQDFKSNGKSLNKLKDFFSKDTHDIFDKIMNFSQQNSLLYKTCFLLIRYFPSHLPTAHKLVTIMLNLEKPVTSQPQYHVIYLEANLKVNAM